MKTLSPLPTHRSFMTNWRVGIGLLTLLSAITAGIVFSQTVLPPEIALPSEPLYMNGAKSKGNVTLALSVEKPTVGQTYRDSFDSTKKYVGYFDPMVCYRQVPAASGSNNGSYFDVSNSAGKSALPSKCASSQFDGNFMNWATSSAIDIFPSCWQRQVWGSSCAFSPSMRNRRLSCRTWKRICRWRSLLTKCSI